MTTIVKTKSGSTYMMNHKDGKPYIQKGLYIGEIVKIKEPIRIGGIINIDLIPLNMYGISTEDISFLRSTPIVDIVIQ